MHTYRSTTNEYTGNVLFDWIENLLQHPLRRAYIYVLVCVFLHSLAKYKFEKVLFVFHAVQNFISNRQYTFYMENEMLLAKWTKTNSVHKIGKKSMILRQSMLFSKILMKHQPAWVWRIFHSSNHCIWFHHLSVVFIFHF